MCYERRMKSSVQVVAYRPPRPAPLLLLRERVGGPELEPENATDWSRVHERLAALGKDRAVHERELCRWLLAARPGATRRT